jgi:hypothetical protein
MKLGRIRDCGRFRRHIHRLGGVVPESRIRAFKSFVRYGCFRVIYAILDLLPLPANIGAILGLFALPVERYAAVLTHASIALETIPADLGTPLARLISPSVANCTEDISAPIASTGDIHAVRAQEFAALHFSELHSKPPRATFRCF